MSSCSSEKRTEVLNLPVEIRKVYTKMETVGLGLEEWDSWKGLIEGGGPGGT